MDTSNRLSWERADFCRKETSEVLELWSLHNPRSLSISLESAIQDRSPKCLPPAKLTPINGESEIDIFPQFSKPTGTVLTPPSSSCMETLPNITNFSFSKPSISPLTPPPDSQTIKKEKSKKKEFFDKMNFHTYRGNAAKTSLSALCSKMSYKKPQFHLFKDQDYSKHKCKGHPGSPKQNSKILGSPFKGEEATNGQKNSSKQLVFSIDEENILFCKVCGKPYKNQNCLSKHEWEHTDAWKTFSSLPLSKHQIVQILEAAQTLTKITHGHHSPI